MSWWRCDVSDKPVDLDECLSEGPQSALEKKFVDDYLQSKGYSRQNLQKLPEELVNQLMKEACMYASLKLAEVQAKSQFREEIHLP
jgi:hypothetical protein